MVRSAMRLIAPGLPKAYRDMHLDKDDLEP